ncbi:MAG: hypothetical protein JWP12_2531 [Bacteroidetes bacterium]|nr:hypothetical protein [Bacteroidota bacterium]
MTAVAGAPFSNTYGPLVITGTPSTTAQSIFVSVAINGSVVTQNNLTPQAPNLIWTNLQVGSETTSGNVSALFATGTDTNSLTANSLSWNSPRGGAGTGSGQVGQW